MPRSTLLLLCICCFLAAVIHLELQYFDDSLPSSHREHVKTRPTEKMRYRVELDSQNSPFQMPAIEQFGEITDRPLFMSSRRQAPVAHALEPYQLRGTVLSTNRDIALVARRTDNSVLRVLEGDSLGSWQVRTIENDAIVLSNGEDSYIMTIAEMQNENAFDNESEDLLVINVADAIEGEPVEGYADILPDRYKHYEQVNQQPAEIGSVVDAAGIGLDQWPSLPGELVLPPPPRLRLRPDRMFRDATRG